MHDDEATSKRSTSAIRRLFDRIRSFFGLSRDQPQEIVVRESPPPVVTYSPPVTQKPSSPEIARPKTNHNWEAKEAESKSRRPDRQSPYSSFAEYRKQKSERSMDEYRKKYGDYNSD